MVATRSRLTLDDLTLSTGKRARLTRLMYGHGARNGTLMLLPIDQGLEHGPRDFIENPASADPDYELRLAAEGGFNGIVYQIGIAEKYMHKMAGRVPLVLKLNGKTEIPSDDNPFSPLLSDVEDAVRLGADAVGYTLYVGSSRQDEDFRQFATVRKDAEKYGMPIIVWAYPRGSAVEAKGGKESLFAIDYAARAATEVGADIVKLNEPKFEEAHAAQYPKEYRELKLQHEEGIHKVVQSAGRSLVLLSGGSMISDEELVEKGRAAMRAGVTGLIFGRNIWQRKYDDALAISHKLAQLMTEYPS